MNTVNKRREYKYSGYPANLPPAWKLKLVIQSFLKCIETPSRVKAKRRRKKPLKNQLKNAPQTLENEPIITSEHPGRISIENKVLEQAAFQAATHCWQTLSNQVASLAYLSHYKKILVWKYGAMSLVNSAADSAILDHFTRVITNIPLHAAFASIILDHASNLMASGDITAANTLLNTHAKKITKNGTFLERAFLMAFRTLAGYVELVIAKQQTTGTQSLLGNQFAAQSLDNRMQSKALAVVRYAKGMLSIGYSGNFDSAIKVAVETLLYYNKVTEAEKLLDNYLQINPLQPSPYVFLHHFYSKYRQNDIIQKRRNLMELSKVSSCDENLIDACDILDDDAAEKIRILMNLVDHHEWCKSEEVWGKLATTLIIEVTRCKNLLQLRRIRVEIKGRRSWWDSYHFLVPDVRRQEDRFSKLIISKVIVAAVMYGTEHAFVQPLSEAEEPITIGGGFEVSKAITAADEVRKKLQRLVLVDEGMPDESEQDFYDMLQLRCNNDASGPNEDEQSETGHAPSRSSVRGSRSSIANTSESGGSVFGFDSSDDERSLGAFYFNSSSSDSDHPQSDGDFTNDSWELEEEDPPSETVSDRGGDSVNVTSTNVGVRREPDSGQKPVGVEPIRRPGSDHLEDLSPAETSPQPSAPDATKRIESTRKSRTPTAADVHPRNGLLERSERSFAIVAQSTSEKRLSTNPETPGGGLVDSSDATFAVPDDRRSQVAISQPVVVVQGLPDPATTSQEEYLKLFFEELHMAPGTMISTQGKVTSTIDIKNLRRNLLPAYDLALKSPSVAKNRLNDGAVSDSSIEFVAEAMVPWAQPSAVADQEENPLNDSHPLTSLNFGDESDIFCSEERSLTPRDVRLSQATPRADRIASSLTRRVVQLTSTQVKNVAAMPRTMPLKQLSVGGQDVEKERSGSSKTSRDVSIGHMSSYRKSSSYREAAAGRRRQRTLEGSVASPLVVESTAQAGRQGTENSRNKGSVSLQRDESQLRQSVARSRKVGDSSPELMTELANISRRSSSDKDVVGRNALVAPVPPQQSPRKPNGSDTSSRGRSNISRTGSSADQSILVRDKQNFLRLGVGGPCAGEATPFASTQSCLQRNSTINAAEGRGTGGTEQLTESSIAESMAKDSRQVSVNGNRSVDRDPSTQALEHPNKRRDASGDVDISKSANTKLGEKRRPEEVVKGVENKMASKNVRSDSKVASRRKGPIDQNLSVEVIPVDSLLNGTVIERCPKKRKKLEKKASTSAELALAATAKSNVEIGDAKKKKRKSKDDGQRVNELITEKLMSEKKKRKKDRTPEKRASIGEKENVNGESDGRLVGKKVTAKAARDKKKSEKSAEKKKKLKDKESAKVVSRPHQENGAMDDGPGDTKDATKTRKRKKSSSRDISWKTGKSPQMAFSDKPPSTKKKRKRTDTSVERVGVTDLVPGNLAGTSAPIKKKKEKISEYFEISAKLSDKKKRKTTEGCEASGITMAASATTSKSEKKNKRKKDGSDKIECLAQEENLGVIKKSNRKSKLQTSKSHTNQANKRIPAGSGKCVDTTDKNHSKNNVALDSKKTKKSVEPAINLVSDGAKKKKSKTKSKSLVVPDDVVVGFVEKVKSWQQSQDKDLPVSTEPVGIPEKLEKKRKKADKVEKKSSKNRVHGEKKSSSKKKRGHSDSKDKERRKSKKGKSKDKKSKKKSK